MYWWIKVRINKIKIFIFFFLKKVLYKEKVYWSFYLKILKILIYRISEIIIYVYKIDV